MDKCVRNQFSLLISRLWSNARAIFGHIIYNLTVVFELLCTRYLLNICKTMHIKSLGHLIFSSYHTDYGTYNIVMTYNDKVIQIRRMSF